MSARILDGKSLAEQMRQEIAREAKDLGRALGRPVGLATVLVGEDSASRTYVRNKRRVCAEVGFRSFDYDLAPDISEADLLRFIGELNTRPEVDGILVQLPLPPAVNADRIIAAIHPSKDVDGIHPFNLGRLLAGHPTLVPCTPAGILHLLETTGLPLRGKKAVVVGRSLIVGKPVALLLLQAHATVTVCHSRTADLEAEVRSADVLVAAVGKCGCIPAAWLKPGVVAIDVGQNRREGKLCGDLEFEAARERAAFITPVPGGVGPMTIAHLMSNTLQAARLRREVVS